MPDFTIIDPEDARLEAGEPPEIRDDEDGRPAVTLDLLAATTRRTIDALVRTNDPNPWLFERGGVLTRIRRERTIHGEARTAEPLTPDALLGELSDRIDFRKETHDGPRPADPPMKLVRNVLARPEWSFPVLAGVARTPTYDRKGRLIQSPGYDPVSGLWMDLDPSVTIPDVPDHPSTSEVTSAKKVIDDVLADFPFARESDRAHAIAAMLQPFVREMITGATPIFLFEAPTAGTGKGLLSEVLSIPACGRGTGFIPPARDEEEIRKRITALLAGGNSVVRLDNLEGKLASPVLCAAITAPVWTDRILGVSRTASIPNRATWFITANNLSLSRDLVRRSVRIRLDARVESPETRTGFRHPALESYVVDHRGSLIYACLVLIQKWIAQGCPPCRDRVLGSFEKWGEVLGGILACAEIPGFLDDREEFSRNADTDTDGWRTFVNAWADTYGMLPQHVSDLIPLADELLPSVVGDGTDRSRATRLGNALKRNRDRIFAGYQIHPAEVTDGKTRRRPGWCLRKILETPLQGMGGMGNGSGLGSQTFPYLDQGMGNGFGTGFSNFQDNEKGHEKQEDEH